MLTAHLLHLRIPFLNASVGGNPETPGKPVSLLSYRSTVLTSAFAYPKSGLANVMLRRDSS